MTSLQASQRSRPESSTLHLPLVSAGDRIRWLGEQWTVDRILYSRSFRVFFSCTDVDGNLEFIAADGSDGGYELLPPAAARDSDSARSGFVARPRACLTEPAVTLAPSPAAAVDFVAAAAASEELLSHGGPGEPGTGGDVSLRETAGSSSEAIARPVDDWHFPRQAWRP